MTEKIIDQGKSAFRPRARIVKTIGKDLISNEIVALVELIKNAYDADATSVKMIFSDPLKRGDGSISIEDNGIGMSLETVKGAWFEPATVSKVRNTVTERGRRVTGEKGIGRFATARIAKHLKMTTSPADSEYVVQAEFDWGDFDDDQRYLDEVKCSWRAIEGSSLLDRGTILRLSDLNDDWTKTSIEKLRTELSRLVSPSLTADRRDDFAITFDLPQRYEELAGEVSPPKVITHPHYKLTGNVDENGNVSAIYEGLDSAESIRLDDTVVIEDNCPPSSGGFSFEFRVWDRDTIALEPLVRKLGQGVRDIRRDLDSAYGISIYRDGFRILLADRDWLGLDHRRVQNPTLRLSNNQVIGFVWTSADKNKELSDQSDREGIVNSKAFDEFKTVIITLLSKVESRRYKFRHKEDSTDEIGSLFDNLDFGPVKSYLKSRYPEDKDLITFIDDKSKSFSHGVREAKKVISRYRRLATLGTLIDVVIHEGRTQVGAIRNATDIGLKAAPVGSSMPINRRKVEQQFRSIAEYTGILAKQFDDLAPLSGRKRRKRTEVTVENAIRQACRYEAKNIEKLDVEITIPSSQNTMIADHGDVIQIFLNLLQNSLHWLTKVPREKRKIVVEITEVNGQLEVLFSDSGPGVEEDIAGQIFDPYFSSKPDGVGLGLTIAGESAVECHGTLELVEGGPLSGANFRVLFARGKE